MATRRIERTQESRRLLIAAAAELFAEKGYRQTSFIDIAERADISRGSIPWHFGNKLGLLEAVVDDRLQVVMRRFTPPPGDPLDQLMDFIRRPDTRLFITLLAEAVEDDSPLRANYARLHAALRQGAQSWIPAEALPPGATPEAVAVLLVGVVIGLHAQWRVAPEAVDLDTVRTTMRALLPAPLGT
ncbi:TetR/AcrR family transcriptional regulator [Streptomyces sp. LX-29]|uniref:TetR/AcrR family transcriptional regulator n=1 Tax=Streptomyces sp. LX-29 TaxID=2900152 RepID=UPI00240E97EA|nr:TetR/AcrR family transcriptional regulator [Streptomyces sp. LX-29]WFB06019.1 TetR/AcrR family transcriptional regulator [Streptomyces sp. LX-29]